METLISVKNVSKIYNEGKPNEVRALDDVSLTINYGEFVAILGQSGSGKSTLMNILGALDVPTYGEYTLADIPVSTMKLSKLSKIRNEQIGFIFQGFNLIPMLSAIENVELPLIYRAMSKKKRKKAAFDALESVGLSERLHHKPTELSGGQQQRVAVARAIASNPPIIMADEPTGNLDSKSGVEVMKMLTDLNNEQGVSIILITHDNELAKLAKRTITISDGKIISDVTNGGI
ncbi:MAG: ABC transporter ATP-binding protein [Clostridia bacterium]